jgi:two-component system, cell cycle response regulator
MDKPRIRVLLVEDNPGDARLILEALKESRWTEFDLVQADTLSQALQRVAESQIDIMLLDLTLPDSTGLATLRKAREGAPHVPVVVLTGLHDETIANSAVNEGAQDFLVKGQVDTGVLDRGIRYAIERHRVLEEMRKLAVVDELTGLRNRHGLMVLFEHYRELALRKGLSFTILFIDIDDMKAINDTFGHQEGDHALVDTARLLTSTFRKADVVARLGGDEFCVLLVDNPDLKLEIPVDRLLANLAAHNAAKLRPYQLLLSIGNACYDPLEPHSIEELMKRADQVMYKQKQAKKDAAA